MIAPWSLSILVKNEGLPYVTYVTISENGKETAILSTLNIKALWHWELSVNISLQRLIPGSLHSTCFFLLIPGLNFFFNDAELIYNVVLVSGVQHSDSVIHIYSFSNSFPIQVITECGVEFPVVYGRSFLVICFVYSGMCMPIPTSYNLCCGESNLVTCCVLSKLPRFSPRCFQCHKIPPRVLFMGIFLPVSHLFVTVTFPFSITKVSSTEFLCCMAGVSETTEVSTSPSSNHSQIHFQS